MCLEDRKRKGLYRDRVIVCLEDRKRKFIVLLEV